MLALLFALVDLHEFRANVSRWNFRLLPVFLLLNAVTIGVFALRWKLLLHSKIGFKRALISTAIGLGANQVLAARAGDLLRAIHTGRSHEVTMHEAFAALVLEKVVDLITVGFLGLLAVGALLGSREPGAMLGPLLVAVAALTLASGFVILATRPQAIALLRWTSVALRLPLRFYRHGRRLLRALGSVASTRMLLSQMCLAIFIWLVLYSSVYVVVAAMLDMSLSPIQAAALLFAGAIGLALPGAPSGLGTFHAAIVSGGLLVGLTAGAALALATALHGIQFVVYSILGGMAYALDHGGADRR